MKSEKKINPADLPDLLEYDPASGLFTWKFRPIRFFSHLPDPEAWQRRFNTQFAGKAALTARHNAGYCSGSIFNSMVLAHRTAWAYVKGAWPTHEIDHINGNRTDNRIANLRDVIRQQNTKNRRIGKRNRSGAIGVYWAPHAGKWRAEIKSERGREHLGYFQSFGDAKAARMAANDRHGFHPNHGRKS